MQRQAQFRFFAGPIKEQPLVNLLPLATPLTLHIDPSSACNLRCEFCPTGHPDLIRQFGKPTAMMEFGLFKKIVADLKQFPDRLMRLHLYKDGEPLLNDALPLMVAHAKTADIAYSVETTTNGLLLTEEVGCRLAKAGLDRIRISLQHVDAAGYWSLTKRRIDTNVLFARVRGAIAQLRLHNPSCRVHVKLLDTGLTVEQIATFVDAFGAVADDIHVDALMGWTHGDMFDFTLGKGPQTGMNSETPLNVKRLVCSQPFYTMAINAGGMVSVCCVDWAQAATVGHVAQERLRDIWFGERMRTFRMLHLEGRRWENSACATCSYILGLPDRADLDTASLSLRKVYGAAEGQDCNMERSCASE